MSRSSSPSKVPARPSGSQSVILLIICVLACFTAAAIGSAATLPNIPGWYQGLHKPGFTPPNTVFGPVWTILYILMAVALWRVVIRSAGRERTRAITIFAIQLVLNALWSVFFFGLHAIAFGLGVIVLLALAIGATIAAFSRIDSTAAWMLVPYVVWVGYASLLNLAIFILN